MSFGNETINERTILCGGSRRRSKLNLDAALCAPRKAGRIEDIPRFPMSRGPEAKESSLDIQLARAIIIMARSRSRALLRKQIVNCG